jgi:uncharacterized membrane protein YtjA (UPF0391 family)
MGFRALNTLVSVIFKRHTETGRLIALFYWAAVFLIIAIVAAILGFGGIAGTAAWIAEVLFVVFLILLVLSLIFGWRGRR